MDYIVALLIENWRKVLACTDYQAYVHPWPSMGVEQRQSIIKAIGKLGFVEDNEACGVTTLRASWGFLVVPPIGFPELKISFRPHVTTPDASKILAGIAQIIADHTRIITP